MKAWMMAIVGVLTTLNVSAQYFYNDVIATEISNRQYQLLRQQKIKKITAFSYTPNGEKTEGFAVTQEISNDGKKITTTTTLSSGGSTSLTTQYENNRIKKSTDASHKVETVTLYNYHQNGKLASITSSTVDTAVNGSMGETHIWMYNEKGTATQMWKVKNRTDTTFVNFVYDEKDNIAEERWTRKGKITETYYYYYNNQNVVTDIVKYNTRAQKLLPELMYEYDNNNRLTQMIQVSGGGSNYLTWIYSYNEKGLKETETCYDKSKKLVGKFGYVYE